MKKNNLIQSVQRAIDILDCFDKDNIELSLSEITEKVALHKSTVYGIVNTLYYNNYLTQDPNTSKYSLGIRLLIKSSLTSAKLNLKNIANKYIESITNNYDLTTHLNIIENNKIFCLDKLTSSTSYYTFSSVIGRELPLYATASGKLFLAFLNEEDSMNIINDLEFESYTEHTITSKEQLLENLITIRKRGYSIEDEEVEYGAVSIAAPIFQKSMNKIIGSISITTSSQKFEMIKKSIIKDLIADADKISNSFSEYN